MVKHLVVLLFGLIASFAFGQNGLHCDLHLQLDVIKQQIEKGADVNRCVNDQRSPLFWAGIQGHIDIIHTLLDAGANQDSKSEALYIAASNGHFEAVELLLKSRANLNHTDGEGKTALIGASENGELEIVKTLLKAGASANDQDSFGWTAVMWAGYMGHFDTAKVLINNGANRKQLKESIFLGAVQRGDSLLLELLPLTDINLETHDRRGWTPLTIAANNSYLKIVEFLLQKSVNANSAELENRATALMYAAGHCDTEMVKNILKHDANVNLLSKNGETALMLSSFGPKDGSCMTTVELLVGSGAKTNVKNNEGKTAIDLFQEQQQSKIVQYLQKHSQQD